MKILMAILLIV